jgi:hypothetical protein
MRQSILVIICLFLGQNIQAQFFSFSPFRNVEVLQQGDLIQNPFSGSYNSGQFWPIDLNNDNIDDLIIYDKTSGRVLTYLAALENGNYFWSYNSDYEYFIPPIESWLATADFNCDGKKDLFTQTSAGIKVFRNVSQVPGQAAFVLEIDGLTSQGFSGQINVQVNPYGAPAIVDVDNDFNLIFLLYFFFFIKISHRIIRNNRYSSDGLFNSNCKKENIRQILILLYCFSVPPYSKTKHDNSINAK